MKKIHTVFVTYNRLELTVRAIETYLATVGDEFSYVVVDNGSTDGTETWLCTSSHPSILLGENRYPGHAANVGWDDAPPSAELLHRADNDFVFLPGWRDEVERMFTRYEQLGQLGLRTAKEENFAQSNTGGNCVVRRSMFTSGVRYDETPWTEYPPGWTEDSYFSPSVREAGWEWDRVRRPCIQSISLESPDDPYYQGTWADRRIYGFGER